jgi:hypothetical protein
MTAANWSSVSKTEKSSSGKKLNGKTIRPAIDHKGFIASLLFQRLDLRFRLLVS